MNIAQQQGIQEHEQGQQDQARLDRGGQIDDWYDQYDDGRAEYKEQMNHEQRHVGGERDHQPPPQQEGQYLQARHNKEMCSKNGS